MSTITFKCPNCDADLSYQPGTGGFGCMYCDSKFSEEELKRLVGSQKIIDEQETYEPVAEGEAVVYSCPSCGAEVATDATTAATFCFFCHNPVIMKGRLSGDKAPHKVIPFKIPQAEVKKKLLDWCAAKKYIEDDFCSDMQMEKLSGVYFPFFVVDSTVDATLAASSTKIRVWRVGDVEYTETTAFAHDRAGEVKVNDLTLKAIDREDAELLNGVYPYDMKELRDFDMSFLSGFLAETRNLERKDLQAKADEVAKAASQELLMDTVSGYGSARMESLKVRTRAADWCYSLLPSYMMTYRYKGELYYFAMNGQTGKVSGRVPVSDKKLNKLMLTITACAGVIGALLGGLVL